MVGTPEPEVIIFADNNLCNTVSRDPVDKLYTMRACSSLGQNLSTSTYIGEISYAIVIAVLGLVLFALLIGNMQVCNVWPTVSCFSSSELYKTHPPTDIPPIHDSPIRRVEDKENGHRRMDASQTTTTGIEAMRATV